MNYVSKLTNYFVDWSAYFYKRIFKGIHYAMILKVWILCTVLFVWFTFLHLCPFIPLLFIPRAGLYLFGCFFRPNAWSIILRLGKEKFEYNQFLKNCFMNIEWNSNCYRISVEKKPYSQLIYMYMYMYPYYDSSGVFLF